MANTVALLAPTGLLGSQLLPVLAAKHKQGVIRLIVLHRATSDVSKVPSDVEKRVFDFAAVTPELLQTALAGVDVLISATGKTPLEADQQFQAALASVKSLKVYFPSDYAINYTEKEEADVANAIVNTKAQLTAQANELQLPIARVHNGLFEQFLGAAGVDIAKNTVGVYSEALKKPLPVTGPSYLAAVLGELVALPPAETLGRTFTVVEYEATGQDFIDALAKVNGSQPAFTPYTAEAEAAAHASGIFGALAASLQHKWAFGSFPNNDAFNPASIPRRTVEQSVTSLKQ